MADIVLSKGIRSNLLQLQNTAANVTLTQGRLSTGKKVNTALDNPTNFFTASALNGRAGDLGALLDGLSNGIKVLEAADNGLTAITKTIESLQSTVRQARQDKTFKTSSYTYDKTDFDGASPMSMSFSGGAVGSTPVAVSLQKSTVQGSGFAAVTAGTAGTITITNANVNGGAAVTVTLANGDDAATIAGKINTALDAATGGDGGVSASVDSGGQLVLSSLNGGAITVANGTASGGVAQIGLGGSTAYVGKSVDELVDSINKNTGLTGKIRASNDAGKLRIENQSTSDLTVTGITAGAIDGGSGTGTIGPNDVRKNLVVQFNDLRNQLDKLADDSSYNGINLLLGDKLKLFLNENSTSTLEIQAKNNNGNARAINNTELGITSATDAEFESDTALDARLDNLKTAMDVVRSQASSFGSNLSIVENRQDFTKKMINTLKGGADNLTLADMNEEAANLLALQTRQQLSQTALSLANQADQGVLRLFG
ncbi:flagellin N-terminal helical domain-containing protein [Prosthecomicrobium sp. N25]|uniref:flagellin N-terminal helical domain-containing protein n=1 Tax=Prosthecomicrobium sp. N25 TaxID=3129254 RepID=UPI003076EBE2